MNTHTMGNVFFFSLKDFSVGSVISPIDHSFRGSTSKEDIEKALENLRICEFKDYPSRLKCTFVAPSEEAANEWCKCVKSFKWASQGCYLEYYIYELSGSSVLWFNADVLMQIKYPDNKKEVDEIAKEYWLSCSKEKLDSVFSDIEGITDKDLIVVSKKKMCLDKDRTYKELK